MMNRFPRIAFKFSLRRYSLVFRTLFLGSQVLFAEVFLSGTGDIILDVQALTVGRCKLSVSKPLLTAPMVSALETIK
jgi:hypothetical protein